MLLQPIFNDICSRFPSSSDDEKRAREGFRDNFVNQIYDRGVKMNDQIKNFNS